MNKVLALYFSGTNNTTYAVKRFCDKLEKNNIECKMINIEKFNDEFSEFDTILIAHPIYGSNMPRIMKDFIKNNKENLCNKNLITLVTQHSFSGDGGFLAVRLIKTKKKHLGSIHVEMPSNISDLAIFKVKNGKENNKKIEKANARIDRFVECILKGESFYDGKGFLARLFAFLGQRIYLDYIYNRLRKGLKIDKNRCTLCGICQRCCPMKNIDITEKDIVTKNNCTLCYRCINVCPNKAISLITKKKPNVQYEGIN